jgi:hypothetical protein
MFAISAPASRRMSELLVPKAENAILRIVQQSGRFRMRFSQVRPGDETFAHEGSVVLALDETTRKSLAGRSLRLKNTPDGPRLRLTSR